MDTALPEEPEFPDFVEAPEVAELACVDGDVVSVDEGGGEGAVVVANMSESSHSIWKITLSMPYGREEKESKNTNEGYPDT